MSGDHARFQRDYARSEHAEVGGTASSAVLEEGEPASNEREAVSTRSVVAHRSGVDIRWIVALFAIGIALMVGAVLLYKAGWLAQGSGQYAVDSYGEAYSATIGRTLDDIVFEDFLFTVNPYLFALGGATVLGTFFLLAVRGVRRRVE